MLSEKGRLEIKIADFGFSCYFDKEWTGEKLDISLGSPYYMAPELVGH